jgi:hypothetical protein
VHGTLDRPLIVLLVRTTPPFSTVVVVLVIEQAIKWDLVKFYHSTSVKKCMGTDSMSDASHLAFLLEFHAT